MTSSPPSVILLAGPNGAGKSTTAPTLLKGAMRVEEFVNADALAQGLSGFAPQRVGMAAGKIMIRRLRELAAGRISFAFETTLASRSFAPWIAGLIETGYVFHLVFLWLPSADVAVARVAERVCTGGHDVPEETIRRRYEAGLRNFFNYYQPLATGWRMYDNSRISGPRLIVKGERTRATKVHDKRTWDTIVARYH